MQVAEYSLFVLASYLIGSIPFAYIVVKLARGVDIRTVGSGNVGATNAARVLGKKGFISVFILDLLKGFFPVFAASKFFGEDAIVLVVLAAAVLGHTFTIFLSFKGGKGVATGAGAFMAIAPVEVCIALIIFLVAFTATRMVSAGSILAAIALFLTILLMETWGMLKVFAAIVVAFVIYKHRSNIVRILNGTENRFERKRKKN